MDGPLAGLKDALADRYAIEREIGAGGMAMVYLATDLKHHRRVAVKVLRPELAATLGPARFLREIEIAAQLQHPHILPLLDSGDARGFLYYVMPFVEGESLRDRLARQGELPVPDAVRLLRDVADALSYAHGRGVVHRDIKPDNVLLTGRHALVTDFGVAKAVSEATGRQTLTTAGVALGTPAYMAPEQAAADPHVDHRADLYALGAMGYELLAGRPPFAGLTPQQVLAAHVTEAPQPVTGHRPACPPALAEAIMRCLAKRPADRWQSADALLEQLESLGTPSGGTTPTSTQPTAAVPSDRWYGHPLRVAGQFTLAGVAVLGAVYFLTVQLGLPDWVPLGAVVLLGLGFPIMVITGLIERRRARVRATGVHSGGEAGLRRWITWRRAVAGGVLAFAGLGLVTIVYTAMRLLGIGPVGTLVAAGKLEERDRVVVADFENRTADSGLSQSLTEAFRIDLGQSPVLSVVSGGEIAGALRRMQRDAAGRLDPGTARELALREGAKAVVVGDIGPVGRGYVLTARVLASADGAELVALRETAEDDGAILGALDRLSKRLRERVGESLRSLRNTDRLDRVTTASLEALRLYSEGVRAADLGHSERAAAILRQAVAEDSGFAMAWRKLAVALGNANASLEEQVTASTNAYRHRDRLPEVERHLTVAYYHSTADFDRERAATAYRQVLALDPGHYVALNNLGLIYEERSEWAAAESLFTRAAERRPTVQNHAGMIRTQLAQGRVATARETSARLRELVPDSWLADFSGIILDANTGQYDSALAAVARVAVRHRGVPDAVTGARSAGGAVYLVQGRLAEAEREFRAAMANEEQRGIARGYVSNASRLALVEAIYRKNPAEGLRVMDRALGRFNLAGVTPKDRPYSELAGFYALAGQPERAGRLLAEYRSAVPEGVRRGDPMRHWAAGQLALAEGKAPDAMTAIRAWQAEIGCPDCGEFELGRAWDLAGRPDSALAAYLRSVTRPPGAFSFEGHAWTRARSYHRLGELYEARGDRERALEYYGKLTALWERADPELQPEVREVKQRMARLAGES